MNFYNCICDSNIWINVCLGDVHTNYVDAYKTIGIADAVHNEIVKFGESEGRSQQIYSSYIENIGKGVRKINIEDFSETEQKLISNELIRRGFIDRDNTSKIIKNLGEYVSLVYAYFLEVPFIHTHDLKFCDEILMSDIYEQYKGIEIITWHSLSEALVASFKDKMLLNKKIEQEQVQMKREYTSVKEEKKLDLKISALAQKFKKNHQISIRS